METETLPNMLKHESEQVEDVELKGASLNARARLDPRPSDDEEDPLNWPLMLKLLILFEVCWLACVSSNSPLVTESAILNTRGFS